MADSDENDPRNDDSSGAWSMPYDDNRAAGPGRYGTAPLVVGQYRIKRVIGQGGMGTVYEAQHIDSPRKAAIKLLSASPDDAVANARFTIEMRVLESLTHRGIARLYDSGSLDEPSQKGRRPYFVMEYIAGSETIVEFCRKHSIPLLRRIAIMRDVCEAVHHGHTKGVIHRDIKPANILMTEEGHPKLIDFGIARVLEPMGGQHAELTQAGQFIGTLSYSSPEQLSGKRGGIDTRSDIYSLGVVLFELLAERPPLPISLLPLTDATQLVLEGKVPSLAPTIALPRVEDINAILTKAMAKEPSDRYSSAQALADDLSRYMADEPISVKPTRAIVRSIRAARRFLRRNLP